MMYVKPSQDAATDFAQARDAIEATGIEVLSGAWGDGILTVETSEAVPQDLIEALGLAEG